MTLDVSGSEEDIDDVIDELYDLVAAGLSVTFNGATVTTDCRKSKKDSSRGKRIVN